MTAIFEESSPLTEHALPELQTIIDQHFCTADVSLGGGETSGRADLRLCMLGNVNLLRYRGAGLQKANRSWKHIRNDLDKDYMLYLPQSAEVLMRQDDRNTKMTPGTFAIVSMARPFSGAIYGADQRSDYAAVHARIPAALLRERFPKVDDFCNYAFPLRPGACRFMISVIDSAMNDAAMLDERHAGRYAEFLVDLIAQATREYAEGLRTDATAEDRRMRVFARACAYIDAHLSDSHLTTVKIAENCGVSLRCLHAAFEGSEWTVAGYVREQRLTKIQAALRNPDLRNTPITTIAFDWGFNDAAHFSRVYKARFGYPPSQGRH